LFSLLCVCHCYCRIDPTSACRVEVTVNSYFSVRDGRKEYNRGRPVSYVVDSEAYSIIDLEKDIASEFKWASEQQANFWVLTGEGSLTCKLASDAQLLDLLRTSRVVKLFMVVGSREQNVREEEMAAAAVNIGDEEMPTAVNIGEEEMLTIVNMEEEAMPIAMDHNLEVHDRGFTWAEVPEYGETIGGPPILEEEEEEHFRTIGCDPDGDEPVGVDEEWRYFKRTEHVVIDPVDVHKRKRAALEFRDFDTEVVKKLQKRLEKHYYIQLSYFKVWSGRKSAMEDLHGTWEDSFEMLWRFKAALEESCPGSIAEIDCKKINGKMHFSRMFVAVRACVDGFLAGCRPYLGVDSTHLTGKYKGQLATATSIDGHNWMYPVAYGIFGKETKSNWAWFMAQLKRAVGTPCGLTIHTDACKGLAYAVNKVFKGDAEHRECFRHLMANFRKKF
jgi:hypothetical protein